MRTKTWFIAGKSPIDADALNRVEWVDRTTGKIVCGPHGNARQEIREQWSSDLRKLFKAAGLPRAVHSPSDCDDEGSPQVAPTITSPLRRVRHVLRAGKPEPLVLRAEAAADVQAIYWFVGNSLIGRALPGEGIA